MIDDIKLRKVGEPEFNSLPVGVTLIMVGTYPIFVRRVFGRMMPLPQHEQDALRKKHILESI